MEQDHVDDWVELSALYDRADELDELALADLLADLRAQGHPLCEALERMLARRDRLVSGAFLERLPVLYGDDPTPDASHRAGERMGGHVLVEKLGTGGAAEVWLADRVEGTFRREVALKLPFRHQGPGRRHTFLERFDRERDILATLDHPNIARLLDAGVADGQPWLSLELVRGQTITAWCDQRRLPIEARVRLFLQVLLAVEHAHSRLAIHRDLKPGNILVTDAGVVRLLDFGIAKLLSPENDSGGVSDLTAEGGRPMTVRYASPEQLRGETLTTAVDIHALGLVAHELLCGALPYDLAGKSLGAAESIIVTTEALAPSRRTPDSSALAARQCRLEEYRELLRPDLDAIVLHCLQKAPGDRYPSVAALREDLQRWLDHEPVQVVLPSPWYRARKFVRRHSRGVAVSATAGVVMAALLGIAGWQTVASHRESVLAQTAKDFVLDAVRDAEPESSKNAGAAIGPLLDQSVARADRLLVNQPALHAEVLERIAEVDQNLDRYVVAQSVLERVVAIRRGLGQPEKTAQAEIQLAFNSSQIGDDDKATAILAALGPIATPRLLGRRHEVEGWLAWDRGDPALARRLWLDALARSQEAFGTDDPRLVSIYQGLVMAHMSLRDYPAARDYADEEVRITSHAKDTTMTRRIAARSDLAEVSFAAGDYVRALPLTRDTLAACVDAIGTAAEACFVLRQQLAFMLLRTDDIEEATALLTALDAEAANALSPARQVQARAIGLRVAAAGGNSNNRAAALQARVDAALPLKLRLTARLALAEAAVREDRPAAALLQLDALNAYPKDIPADYAARALMIRGVAQQQLADPDKALATVRQAVAAFTEAYGPMHTQTVLCGLNTVAPMLARGDVDAARHQVTLAVALLRERIPPNSMIFARLADLQGKLAGPGATRAVVGPVIFN